jgi:hypothetical protein
MSGRRQFPMAQQRAIPLATVVSALSHALDLSTGQRPGHSVRACLLGMRIAAEIGLPDQSRADLFYAILLKDAGCSSNASKLFQVMIADDLSAKRDLKSAEWNRMGLDTMRFAFTHVAPGKPFLARARALFDAAVRHNVNAKTLVKIRCERGFALARLMGLSDATAYGILNLDEHWDGKGFPEGLRGAEIPILSRIMLLAQTLELFVSKSGLRSALVVANRRRGTWFDPDLVSAVSSLAARGELWNESAANGATEPECVQSGEATLDRVCMAFANIIDAKSPFNFNHSLGVANAAIATARAMDLPRERLVFLRNAALLHDLGKLGISNAILEKPDQLNAEEWKEMRQHPYHTWAILRAVPGFEELSEVAGSHHEKLNGTGYFRGLNGDDLSLEARILTVADIFDALSAERPYRESLPREKVFEMMEQESPHAIDPSCLEALRQSGVESGETFVDLPSRLLQVT